MPDEPSDVPSGFQLLYEEGAVLVLNKRGGLLTQAPPGIDSLEFQARRWLKAKDNKPGKIYLAVTHRLDRPVSGAIVLAKNVRAAKRINQQFRSRTVTKRYWAVVRGNITDDSGHWHDWMRKIPDTAKSEIVASDSPDAKEATLDFTVLNRSGDSTAIEITLGTGRTHQIRLQAASRGLPILGDELYGSTTPFGPQTVDLRKRWIALHARRIAFEHPILHQPVDVTAPLPEHWDVFPELTTAVP